MYHFHGMTHLYHIHVSCVKFTDGAVVKTVSTPELRFQMHCVKSQGSNQSFTVLLSWLD